MFHFYIPWKALIFLTSSRRIEMERWFTMAGVVVQRCSVKKLFLKISQNSQENTCARVSSLIKLQPYVIKKETLARCFPVNFAKFLRTPFLQNTSGGCFSILMRLQDFNCIKHRRGMKNCFSFCLSKKITDI